MGAMVWVGLATVVPPPGLMLGTAELLFLLAPLVVVPLTRAQVPSGEGLAGRIVDATTVLQPVAALLLLAGCFFPNGHLAGGLALPWLALTIAVAFAGALRLARAKSLQHACFAVAQIYLAVGGAWAFASRWGMRPLGFEEPWVILTANHFHYAGYATAMFVGLALPRTSGRAARVARGSAAIVLAGPPIVAAGITGVPILEVVSAVTLASGLFAFALVVLVHLVPRARPRAAGVLLATASASLLVTMAFATAYAVTHFLGKAPLTIPTMVHVHGLLNVLGFCVAGLTGLYLSQPRGEGQVAA